VIPKKIRDILKIKPSDKLHISIKQNKIVLTPVPLLKDVYGMFEPKGHITKKKIKDSKTKHLKTKFEKSRTK